MREAEIPTLAEPRRVTSGIGRAVVAARWLLAPIYIGLVLGIALTGVQIVRELIHAVPAALEATPRDIILAVLQLVDLALEANLVLIVFFAGWEMIIGPLPGAERAGYGNLGFSAVKLKLIAAVAAVAAVSMLETFFHIGDFPKSDVSWQLAILLGIGATGVLLALAERLSGRH